MTDPQTDLHPTLATALACLDVDVDTELARYRRQRQQHEPVPASPPSEVAAMTLASPKSKAKDNDIANYTQTPQRPPDAASSPQDYLASSEKLLKTLDEEPTPKPKRNPWLNPLNVGAIAILGVAIALIIFALREPAPVAEPADAGNDGDTTTATVPSEVGPSGEPLDVTGPDLADDGDDDPATDSTAAASDPDAADADDAAAPIPGRPSDLTSALLPDPNSPIPSPAATPAAPELEEETLPNVASAPPANDPYYYVLVNYTGDASLQQARSAVSDAYLRRFPQGIQVQLGAFDNAADAQRLVNAVQTQGIVAQIYQAQE